MMFVPLRKYADFSGRARRAEYWQFAFFILASLLAVGALTMAMPGGADMLEGNAPPSLLFSLFMLIVGIGMLGVFVPGLAVTVRRLHDTNRSGWWILIRLIPFLGDLVIFVFLVLDGTAGPNRFGADPKGRNPAAEVFD